MEHYTSYKMVIHMNLGREVGFKCNDINTLPQNILHIYQHFFSFLNNYHVYHNYHAFYKNPEFTPLSIQP